MKKVWMKRVKKTLLHSVIYSETAYEIQIDTDKSIKLQGTPNDNGLINIYLIEGRG